uniref:Uncharacterized protein n=1 Tax=Aegilops tauschii TaxID=37682 RepID=M8CBN6_AEGTA
MDEFMSNIWNVEEFQETIGGGPVGMQEAPAVGDGGSGGDGDARGSGLCRQGYFSLPPPLCQKTMEEVWDEINKEPRPVHAQPYVVRSSPQLPVQRMMGNGRKSFCVGFGTSGQALVSVGMVHGHTNPGQQGQQPGLMMYPMAPTNDMFSVMGNDMGFIPNGYTGMAVVPPPPTPQEDDFVDQEKKCYVHFPTIAWQSSYTCHHLPTACNNLIAKFNTVNLVEKMMEQSKKKVNVKKGGALSRRNRS